MSHNCRTKRDEREVSIYNRKAEACLQGLRARCLHVMAYLFEERMPPPGHVIAVLVY